MGLAGVEELLNATMGLSAMSVGSAAVARAVQERLAVCQLDDVDVYLEQLRLSRAELQALIEIVVVPETWFFRDRDAFTALARLVREEWLPGHDGVLSMLSLPCSSGEEPYSMAMALLDANIPADRFRIDAVDISRRSVAQAVAGVYGRNSFRGSELGFRDRHFEPTADGARVTEIVRRQVHFRQGNLFDPDLLPGAGIYHVIFCRNVLIYFDRQTQDRALGVLNRLLHADGVLFVAPAETGLPGAHGLVSTNEPMAFAFRKTQPRPVPARSVAPAPVVRFQRRALVPVPSAPNTVRRTVMNGSLSSPVRRGAPIAADADSLAHAIRLADQGHLVEAASCCEAHLRRSGPSAVAFNLLGLVREATGNPQEAISYYRKSIYLDPDRYETQFQLALLMEKQGDVNEAHVLRTRARRLEQKSRAPRE